MFILDATHISRLLAGKRVEVCELPNGTLEIPHDATALDYRMIDKIRQVNQSAIVDNKQLDAALMMAKLMQAQRPARKWNNNKPGRHSQSGHMVPSPALAIEQPIKRKRGALLVAGSPLSSRRNRCWKATLGARCLRSASPQDLSIGKRSAAQGWQALHMPLPNSAAARVDVQVDDVGRWRLAKRLTIDEARQGAIVDIAARLHSICAKHDLSHAFIDRQW